MTTGSATKEQGTVSQSGPVAMSNVVWHVHAHQRGASMEQINQRLNRNAAAFLARAERNTQRLTGKTRF